MPTIPFDSAFLKAIVFDMDDTLYPERDFILSGFRTVAQWAEDTLGVPYEKGFAAFADMFAAGVRGNTFNEWLALFELTAETDSVSQMVAVYRKHRPDIKPFPGMKTLLVDLNKRFSLGLITDGYLAVQKRKFEALALGQYFKPEAVIFSDRWGRMAWKPSHMPFEAVLTALDVSAGQAVYIADNPSKDFLGAREVGMWTVWFKQSAGEYANLVPPSEIHCPHITVSTVDELTILLQTGLNT